MPVFEYLDDSGLSPPEEGAEQIKNFCDGLMGDEDVPVFRVKKFVDNRTGACGGFCQDALIDGDYEAIEIEVAKSQTPTRQPRQWMAPPAGKYRFTRRRAGDESCELYENAKEEALKASKQDPSEIPQKYNEFCVGMETVESFTSEIGIRSVQPGQPRTGEGVFRDGEEIFEVESGKKLYGQYNVAYSTMLTNGKFSFGCGEDHTSWPNLIDHIQPTTDR